MTVIIEAGAFQYLVCLQWDTSGTINAYVVSSTRVTQKARENNVHIHIITCNHKNDSDYTPICLSLMPLPLVHQLQEAVRDIVRQAHQQERHFTFLTFKSHSHKTNVYPDTSH